jgi:hypothetical protein
MTEIDNIVNFHNVTWEDYRHVCDLRGDGSVPRIDRDTTSQAIRDFRKTLARER